MTRSTTRLNPQLELIKMRLREFVREPGVLFWVFAFPLLMAFGLGNGFLSKPPEHPGVAVVTEHSTTSTQAIRSSPRVMAELKGEASARRDLARAKTDVIVRFDPTGPTYIFDGTQDKGLSGRFI